MIELRGTSHIASGDIDAIRTLIREERPDCVAVELDAARFEALASGNDRRSHHPLIFLVQTMQQLLGRRTGAEPGTDMLAAVDAAQEIGADVALVDRDIRDTLRRVREQVPLREKVKLAGFLLVGPFIGVSARFDLSEVPGEEVVDAALLRFEVGFPHLYDVLVEERNRVMAARLAALDERYGDVLAVVGAGHVAGIAELLDGFDVRVAHRDG